MTDRVIEEITIRNVGGVASASLELNSGLTVITGESGAGKSSIVRSLELLAGKRSQASFLRSGEDEAVVEAVFREEPGNGADAAHDESADDPFFFARRILSRNGRNRTFFQERQVPLSSFASVMNEKIRIQSQFAQIDLLDPSRQREILDFCGGRESASFLDALAGTFSEAVECERSLRTAKKREQELKTRFRDGDTILAAAKGLKLTPECDREWEHELDELSLQLAITRKTRDNLLQITGGTSEQGLLDAMESAGLELLKAIPGEKEELQRLFNEGLESFQLFIKEISMQTGGLSVEELEAKLESLEKKTGLLRKLMRAAGTFSAAAFLEWCSEAKEASEWLRQQEALSASLEERGRSLRKEAGRLAAELRSLRLRSARALSAGVNSHLSGLAMDDSRFSVQVTPLEKIRNTGADEVLFTIAAGDKEASPVNRTASGGELSRILLALQLSLPDASLPGTLVFDEVEAGLGGKAALLSGYKLLELSGKCQVILVTHEATIAALAQHHFMVRKRGESPVEVTPLSGEDRIAEIARMLSGDAGLREAREHARKLLFSRREKRSAPFPENLEISPVSGGKN